MKVRAYGRHFQGGFTLVEIAIVLVIIGLLLGGILKGQEMITQAKIKNVINDFNGVTAAVNSYQDRYRALPGDDFSAATRWAGAQSGNGNGQFDAPACAYNAIPAPPPGMQECNLFWWHLRLGGFVAGGVTVAAASGLQPPNATNGIIGVQTSGMGYTSNIVCTSNLPDKIAIAVDTQMDDGIIGTGTVRGQKHTAGPNPDVNTAADASAYAETGTNVYVLCRAL